MRGGIVWTIFAKELRDTLRDRRTLVVMVLLPIVLYPALGLVMGQLAVHQRMRLEHQVLKVALLGEPGPDLRALVGEHKRLQVVAAAPGADAARLLDEKIADAAVEVPQGTARAIAEGAVAKVTVAVDETRDESREAARRLREILTTYRQQLVDRALRARGLPPGIAEPLRIVERNVASPERMGASLVARTVPLLLVTMIVLGAFYPAIDVTAGEKERGTMETLLTSPVGAMEIVAGKYLAVCAVAMIAGAANLLSLGLTFTQGLTLLPGEGAAGFEITVDRALLVFLMLVPVALLVSALSLAVASLAQSFKEAQNLLSPTILVLVMPSALASLPGLDLDGFTAFVPGLNATLLTKKLLLGEVPLDAIFWVLLASFAYTALALVFAARNFRSEAVLFGSPEGRRGILRLARPEARGRASPGHALFFFALLFVLLWYVAQALQRWDVVGGLVLTQWGLLLAPALAFAWWLRLDLRATFRLRSPGVRGVAAGILAGAGLAVVVPFAVMPLQELVLPVPTRFLESMKEFFQVTRAGMGDVPLLLFVSLTPAVCEEAAFRGLVLDGLRSQLSKTATILAVAAFFGAYHMSVYRFLPTAVAGAAITWVVLETGSIFTGVIAHAVYNGLVFGMGLFAEPETIEAPAWAVVAAFVAVGAGLWLARGRAASLVRSEAT